MSLFTDAELLTRHVAGDRAAFTELVHRHRDRMWAVALRMTRNPDDAADALQDAFLAAHRAAGSYRAQAQVGTWLHRILVNACLDRLRVRSARPTVALDDDAGYEAATVPDPTTGVPTRMAVHDALMAIPLDQRAAVMLVDVQGYAVADAARALGVAEGTVKSRCARGRTKLAVLLGHLREAPPTDGIDTGGNRSAPRSRLIRDDNHGRRRGGEGEDMNGDDHAERARQVREVAERYAGLDPGPVGGVGDPRRTGEVLGALEATVAELATLRDGAGPGVPLPREVAERLDAVLTAAGPPAAAGRASRGHVRRGRRPPHRAARRPAAWVVGLAAVLVLVVAGLGAALSGVLPGWAPRRRSRGGQPHRAAPGTRDGRAARHRAGHPRRVERPGTAAGSGGPRRVPGRQRQARRHTGARLGPGQLPGAPGHGAAAARGHRRIVHRPRRRSDLRGRRTRAAHVAPHRRAVTGGASGVVLRRRVRGGDRRVRATAELAPPEHPARPRRSHG